MLAVRINYELLSFWRSRPRYLRIAAYLATLLGSRLVEFAVDYNIYIVSRIQREPGSVVICCCLMLVGSDDSISLK